MFFLFRFFEDLCLFQIFDFQYLGSHLRFKVYTAISYKIFWKVIIKYKSVLHKYPFDRKSVFNTNCICKLLYMIVTHYRNKTLYNRMLFETNCKDVLKFSRLHRTNPKFKVALCVIFIAKFGLYPLYISKDCHK